MFLYFSHIGSFSTFLQTSGAHAAASTGFMLLQLSFTSCSQSLSVCPTDARPWKEHPTQKEKTVVSLTLITLKVYTSSIKLDLSSLNSTEEESISLFLKCTQSLLSTKVSKVLVPPTCPECACVCSSPKRLDQSTYLPEVNESPIFPASVPVLDALVLFFLFFFKFFYLNTTVMRLFITAFCFYR